MKVTIFPSEISGSVRAAASKSSMQRLCAAALLHQGITYIYNPGTSNDDQAALKVIGDLGAHIKWEDNYLVITSTGISPLVNSINCGESGLSIRMFSSVAALSSVELTLTGEGTLRGRPMNFVDEVFPQLSIAVKSTAGKVPIVLKGPLIPKDITIDGSLSSQFLTGLLFAFAKACKEPVTITVNNLVSKPYIALTLGVLADFGYSISNNNFRSFTVYPSRSNSEVITTTVEGDWSGAAFLLVAAAIAGNICIEGLQMTSPQADRVIIEALKLSGAKVLINNEGISVSTASLQNFQFDASDCPDLFPPLVTLASFCLGKTVIKGVSRLKHKESDRALTLQEEFAKMGVVIELQDDNMIIHGRDKTIAATVHSHHDHRIAMACATAGLRSSSGIIILDAQAINKSYPNFYEHLQQLGVNLHIEN